MHITDNMYVKCTRVFNKKPFLCSFNIKEETIRILKEVLQSKICWELKTIVSHLPVCPQMPVVEVKYQITAAFSFALLRYKFE